MGRKIPLTVLKCGRISVACEHYVFCLVARKFEAVMTGKEFNFYQIRDLNKSVIMIYM